MIGTIVGQAVAMPRSTNNPLRGIKAPKDKAAKLAFSFDRVKAVSEATRENM
jgi:hypothetical protein